MNNEEFINGLVKKRKILIESIIENLEDPPGRYPSKKDLDLNQFWLTMDRPTQMKIKEIITESIDSSIFHFLCILDHVSFIEDDEEKTKFELYASKNGQKQLLNSEDQEELHNIYNYLSKNDHID
jgi:hypothetical protein